MNTKRILAAVDRFPQDDAVLARAHEVAAGQGAALTVVHVVDLPDHAATPASIDTFRGQWELAARDRIEAALRRHGVEHGQADIRIVTGTPGPRLVEMCRRLKPTMIVMGAHQKPWITRKLVGSTSERVMAAGQVPVLIVRQPAGTPYRDALVAVDNPSRAPAALSFVSALLPDAAMHLVQAVQVVPPMEQAMLRIGVVRADVLGYRDALARAAGKRLRSLARSSEPRVTWEVVRGDTVAELAHTARGKDVDLIALGPTRSGLIRRAFMGSVTQGLLRETDCDLLVGSPVSADVPESATGRAAAAPQRPGKQLEHAI